MTTPSISGHHSQPRLVRVLLVDDVSQVRQGLRQLLAITGGIEVVGEAADGEEAVRLVAELHPDAVLMDLEMPVLDGYEATRRIKRETPAVRVIILSVHAGPEEQHLAQAAGADCFVVKGAGYEVLMDAICGERRWPNGRNHKKGHQG